MKKKVKITLKHIFLFILSLFFVHIFFFDLCVPFQHKSFNKRDWEKCLPEQRAKMAEDVIQKHIKRGMTIDEIVTLLGKPNKIWGKKSFLDQYRVKGNITYAYYIGGYVLNKWLDDTFIYIHFDDSSKVLQAEINGF